MPARFHSSAAPQAPHAADLANWWDTFDDPVLTHLVEQALAANSNIDAAGARVRQARAALKSTRSGSWPTLDFGTSASRLMGVGPEAQIPDRTTYDAGFDARYELDLFGGQRRAVQASTADLAAVEANPHSTQLTIAAEVALNYAGCPAGATPAGDRACEPGLPGRDAADRAMARAGRAGRRARSRAVASAPRADGRDGPAARAGAVVRAEPALGADRLRARSRRRAVRAGNPDPDGRRRRGFGPGRNAAAASGRDRRRTHADRRDRPHRCARGRPVSLAGTHAGSISGNTSNWGDLTNASFGSLAADSPRRSSRVADCARPWSNSGRRRSRR
ncbi:MAG: TolC family protein [Proteobacteria bacterium]|nr:TolC family protein [Pseudomonadota bacterium]